MTELTNIAPWLAVNSGTKAIEFYRKGFGSEVIYELEENQKVIIAQLSIKGAFFWIQEDLDSSPDILGQGSIRMVLTVDDPDTLFKQAITAGAVEVYPVTKEHGWRIGRIVDPFGHHWEIGKQLT
ncbi:VOC family protein [Bacillus sp. FJAT-49711]|uniref:VOC family protein n=1 Tax=Bacillus sp. FJAT-49711 TaxID=2833585 RepID=UPI001BC92A8A|nr:VOC family protein [Bacillus sp. FJAT-49711]MBS4216807.1 VOC family protein [Bacillus sp. FJAT-49711]